MRETEQVRDSLADAARVVGSVEAGSVAAVIETLAAVRDAGGTIFVAGNGGSAATASHFALDLQKTARVNGDAARAVSLCDSIGLVTAWANDESFERVFAEQLAALARAGDALVVISVSGSSPNLMAALRYAREKGLVTVGLLGKDGGAARALVDCAVVVASDNYGWVESTHLALEHLITYALLERRVGAPLSTRAVATEK